MSLRSLPLSASSALDLLAAVPADAVGLKQTEGPFGAVHNCTCRLGGEEVTLDQRRCIGTDQGSSGAVCATEQTATSWRRSQDGCPEASIADPRG